MRLIDAGVTVAVVTHRCTLSLLVPILIQFCHATPIQLIPPGAAWRFYKIDGLDQPNNWHEVTFDHVEWTEGVAGFSAGYDDYDQAATPLGFLVSPTLRGLLLRHRFELAEPSQVRSLYLRMEYEDGLLIYLNGVEVARRDSAPEGSVAGDLISVAQPPRRAELIDLTLHLQLLRPGTNLLALQVLESVPDEGTLFAWPELLANFSRGPILQNVSSNQAVILWQAPRADESWVELQPGNGDTERINGTAVGPDRVAFLSRLLPGKCYRYRVGLRIAESLVFSDESCFTTFGTEGNVDFLVIGDTGSGQLGQHLVAERLRQEFFDLVLHVGDLVYPAFTPVHADLRCFSIYQPWMQRMPLFPTPGNHEIYLDFKQYLAAFWLPTNSITGGEHFYSFDHGDVHFVSLFLPWWGLSTLGSIGPAGERSDQYRWLTNDLATTQKPWRIVYLHQPPLTSGPHALDDYDEDDVADVEQLREFLIPLLERHGVQLAFTGHDHSWERFAPTNGIHFVVTGGGGGILYSGVNRDPASAQAMARFHFVRASVRGEELLVEAVDHGGVVFDRFTIRNSVTPPVALGSTWHSPDTTGGPAGADGNRHGERFDFDGTCFTAVAGKSSNLGQLWVNDDTDAIYIGLRDVMLRTHQTLAIFISSPRLAGSPLTNAGTALGHPISSLNLRFGDHPPAAICLLGDEYADATDLGFTRPGTDAPVGQGVFYLDSNLTPIPGASISQFNRSPETGSDPEEQNADFIVVAVPRSRLGAVLPRDTLRISAVAISPVRSNGNIKLEIDSGFIGSSLAGTPVPLLQALPVLLSDPPDGDLDLDGLGPDAEKAYGTNPTNSDSDGDGLTDGWEVGNGLDPISAEGIDGTEGDPDQDGYSNQEEFLSGTDPRDPMEALRIAASYAGGNLVLKWRAIIGRLYHLQQARALTEEFEPVQMGDLPRRALSTNEAILLPISRDSGSHWFRLLETR